MPLSQLYYPYDTNWNPGPIYGGWLAGERENEAGLARLMQMYEAAQGMKKQQQDYNYNEQINPLNIQGKGLANTTAQQALDINAPKAAKALAQVADPNWLSGELESDRLEGQTKDLKNRKQMQADVEDMAINAIDQVMSGLNKGNLSVLPSLEGLPDNYKQIILESIQSGDANWNLNTLREGLLQRQAQRAYNPKKLETEAKLSSAEKIAEMNNAARISAAEMGGRNTQRAVDLEKAYVQARNEWLAANQPQSGPIYDKYVLSYQDFAMEVNANNSRNFSQIGPGGLQSGVQEKLPTTPPGIKPKAEQKADPLGIRK